MKAQDLLAKYPEKSFSEKFKEKEVAIQGIGAPIDQIQAKKAEFQKLFEFDSLLQVLKDKLQNNLEKEFDTYTGERAQFLLSQLSSINSYLESGLTFSNPQDVNSIFSIFQQSVSHLLQQINYNINTTGISSGKQLIDEHINEVRQILRDFDAFSVDREKLQEAEAIAIKLTKNAGRYEKATQTAENWIKSEGRALSSALQDKAQIFNDKAEQDHQSKEVWGWFVGGMVGGVIAFITILIFISKNGTDLSVGSSLLRISVLVVVSYFAFYCLQQFSNHRRLYEIYKFKAIALKTMEELVKSYSEQADRDRILNKATNVVFSEPNLKEDKNVQQKILDELFEIVKKKI